MVWLLLPSWKNPQTKIKTEMKASARIRIGSPSTGTRIQDDFRHKKGGSRSSPLLNLSIKLLVGEVETHSEVVDLDVVKATIGKWILGIGSIP